MSQQPDRCNAYHRRTALGRRAGARRGGGRGVRLCGEDHRGLLPPEFLGASAQARERRVLRHCRGRRGRRLSAQPARRRRPQPGGGAARRAGGAGLPDDRDGGDAAGTGGAGRPTGHESVPLPSSVQGRNRPDAQGLRLGLSCPAPARAPGPGVRLGDRGDLRLGFNSSSRFYESSSQRLGMRPRDYRDGGAGAAIRFAIGQCSLGAILVAQSQRGICAILLGEEPEPLLRELQDQFPRAQLLGGDADFERLVAQVVGFVESPQLGLDLPLDVRGTAFQNGSGRHCGKYRRAARRATRRSPNGSARRERCARWRRPARRTGSRWRFPATRWYVATATFPATAGAWSASANAAQGRAGLNPRPGDTRPGCKKPTRWWALCNRARSFSWFQYPCQGENFVK